MKSRPTSRELPPGIAREIADACMCLNLQRASRVITRRYDDAFRPIGLTSGQFSLLMSLNRPTAPSIGQLAAELAMDRTTLTAYLKPLDRRGLIRTDAHEADARSRVLSLTAAGHALLELAMPAWRRVQQDTLDRTLPLDASALRATLQALAG